MEEYVWWNGKMIIPVYSRGRLKRPPGQLKPVGSSLKHQSWSSVWFLQFSASDIFLLIWINRLLGFGGCWHIIPAFEILISQPKLTETAAKQDVIISGSCSQWATSALPSAKSSSLIRGLLKPLFLHINKANYKCRLRKSETGLSEIDSPLVGFVATAKINPCNAEMR